MFSVNKLANQVFLYSQFSRQGVVIQVKYDGGYRFWAPEFRRPNSENSAEEQIEVKSETRILIYLLILRILKY